MKKWIKKEIKDAKDFNGKRQKASGSYWAHPGDIKNATWLVDSKQTDKSSYSISKKTWDKIAEEALFTYRYPMLSLIIKDIELVVMAKEDFLHLTGEGALHKK